MMGFPELPIRRTSSTPAQAPTVAAFTESCWPEPDFDPKLKMTTQKKTQSQVVFRGGIRSADPRQHMMDRAAGIKGLHHLYHYQPYDLDRLREVIVDGIIYFSKPSDFNDPWDCRPWYDSKSLSDPAALEDHLKLYVTTLRKHHSDLSEAELARRANYYRANPDRTADVIHQFSKVRAQSIDERYRIYCLGTKPDCELMWAHYTTKHQGVCLEFAVQTNLLFAQAMKVRYVQDYPRFSVTAKGAELVEVLLTKSAAWSYENEFRLIGDEAGGPKAADEIATRAGKLAIPEMSLTAVILGCTASRSTRKNIAELVAASPHRPRLKVATRMNDRYQLEISDAQ